MYYNLSQQLVPRRLVAVVWLIDCQLFGRGWHCCYCSDAGDLFELVVTVFSAVNLASTCFRVFPTTFCSASLL